MIKKGSLTFIALMLILSSCSYKDETEENIVIPDNKVNIEKSLENSYKDLAKKCITKGDVVDALELDNLYNLSLNNKDFEKQLLFQQEELSLMHEKCLQKVAHEGHEEFLDKLVLKPHLMGRVSRDFYAKKDYKNGAYWFRKLINNQGEAQGYYTAGMIFVRNPQTLPFGAKLLAESARLGNNYALQMLMQVNSVNTLKRHGISIKEASNKEKESNTKK